MKESKCHDGRTIIVEMTDDEVRSEIYAILRRDPHPAEGSITAAKLAQLRWLIGDPS